MKNLYKFLRLFNMFIPSMEYRRRYRYYFDNLIEERDFTAFEQNYSLIIERIKRKNGKIKAIFLVNENSKWNWQSVYDEMEKSNDFEPLVLITNFYSREEPEYTKYYATFQENYDFFIKHNMHVDFAYDLKNNEYIPLEKFNPDIVFYQQPWGLHPCQSVQEVSKYALTCNVPYGIPVNDVPAEYDLNFYKMLWRFFEINQDMFDFIQKKGKEFTKNRVVTGYPKLDKYFEDMIPVKNEEKYVIYAPHHSFFPTHLNLATFKWNGKFLLQYAKNHPEFKFVFKPHPQLKKRLIQDKVMTEEETNQYYNEWKKVGILCDDADYIDLFRKSKLLITDCASFLVEYFPSKQPVIHLRSRFSSKFIPMIKKITNNYYQAFNLKELKKHLKDVLEDSNDYLKEDRLRTLNDMKFTDKKASLNIMEYLRQKIK